MSPIYMNRPIVVVDCSNSAMRQTIRTILRQFGITNIEEAGDCDKADGMRRSHDVQLVISTSTSSRYRGSTCCMPCVLKAI